MIKLQSSQLPLVVLHTKTCVKERNYQQTMFMQRIYVCCLFLFLHNIPTIELRLLGEIPVTSENAS